MIAGAVVQTGASNTPSIQSSATALEANEGRLGFSIQNLGQNALFVRLGDGATTSIFHIVLKGGTANDDGTGGSLSMESGVIYKGKITIAGTSPRYTVTELAP